ncbi:hypothetical protein CAL28_22865 [Bordetella genomosp. 11]|uniref:Uncharacterized protein n=2 Tax=Bordetella genomosp. 11 TaxID=1416808 RepID=A0A261UJH8_9BORD|nr:hypothetical protein CAL28_22865 [Bordetella genomosp. 11]
MVIFNFLPSRTLHPSRAGDAEFSAYVAALAARPASAPVWHRYWSRRILEREALLDSPITDLTAVGLAVAVLGTDALAALARQIGVVLCTPRLRYAISGEAVRALRARLGDDALRWIRDGRALHPGLPGEMFRDADQALRHVMRAGYAAIHAAFLPAPPEIGRRLFLKLPLAPEDVFATDEPDFGESDPGDAKCGNPHRGDASDAAVATMDPAVAAAVDSDAAMALVTAVHAGSALGGR